MRSPHFVVTVRYDKTAAQWVARFAFPPQVVWFSGSPEVAIGGGSSMEAARQFLEATVPLDARVELRVEQADGTELVQPAVWQVPDLLLQKECPWCSGKGEYTGLATKETCGACCGQGIVPLKE